MSSSPARPQIRRLADRARTRRADLDDILDAGWTGTLSAVVDGLPQVVPLLYARDGDQVLLHGSTGAGTLRAAAAGAPVALCVLHLDGFVYAASLFDSSANYRSAVVTGTCTVLTDEQADRALLALSEHLMPGRPQEVRGNTRKERAATSVLALPIVEGRWAAKMRAAPPSRDQDDDPTVWTGVLPVSTTFGEPVDAPWADGIPVSPSVLTRLGRK